MYAAWRTLGRPHLPQESHNRWKAAHALQWECHYFISNGRADKNLAKGILQLADAFGLTDNLPADFARAISALFAYRNANFHNGFEWPIKERQSFKRRIEEEWRSDWFIVATSAEDPWIFYMSEAFIEHVLSSIERVLEIFGQFVTKNWAEGQTF